MSEKTVRKTLKIRFFLFFFFPFNNMQAGVKLLFQLSYERIRLHLKIEPESARPWVRRSHRLAPRKLHSNWTRHCGDFLAKRNHNEYEIQLRCSKRVAKFHFFKAKQETTSPINFANSAHNSCYNPTKLLLRINTEVKRSPTVEPFSVTSLRAYSLMDHLSRAECIVVRYITIQSK